MPIIKKKVKGKTVFQARVNYTDFLGNHKCKASKWFNYKGDAEIEEVRIRVELEKSDGTGLTFNELYESYKKSQKDKVRIQTWNKYDEIYMHAEPFLGTVRIDKLTVPMYESFKEKLSEKGLSFDRRKRVHRLVKTMLKHAEKMYGITCNVPDRAGGFTDPNETKSEMKFMTYDDFCRFIDTFTDPVYRAFFMTLYFQGLRKGEANALAWKDVDFEKKTVSINRTVAKTKGGYVENPPKTRSSVRTIPLDTKVSEELRELRKHWEQYDGFNEEWKVFGGPKPLHDTLIEKRKNQACELSGTEKIRIHDFRHSCASYYIQLGAPILLVSKLLGHADIAMTLNTYSHLYPNEIAQIFEKSDEFRKIRT